MTRPRAGATKKTPAPPTSMKIIEEGPDAPSSTGFSCIVKSRGFGSRKKMTSTRYRMQAPGVIRVRSEGKKEGEPLFGAALHCIPLGKGRSRLLFKTYAMNFPPMVGFIYGLKPKFLRHLNSCKILEQDMKLICAQEDHVARTGKTLSESFLPIKSSDVMVVELRKWLDRVGHGMPFFEGWQKSKEAADLNDHEDCRRPSHRAFESRYHRHVLICAETRRALATVKQVKKGGLALSALLAAASVLLSRAGAARAAAAAAAAPRGVGSLVAALGSLCLLGLATAANALEARFYTNFERHPSLG
ncbi:unnamed protein product [Ectocarpus sp. CCAP 1310/34]|nr:unnamed protein product [Ectocarpus sp. CCAP 1310/34]